MGPAEQLILALAPLALLFLIVGSWRIRPRPVVLSGHSDFLLLAFGLGGLIVLGPIGEVLVRSIFPAPTIWAWLAIASFYLLLVLLWLPRSHRRMVIYNLDPASVASVVSSALSARPDLGVFQPTMHGFEEASHRRGIRVERGLGGQTTVVESYGEGALLLTSALLLELRSRLAKTPTKARNQLLGMAWLTLAVATIIAPFAASLIDRPRVVAALRAFLEKLQGR